MSLDLLLDVVGFVVGCRWICCWMSLDLMLDVAGLVITLSKKTTSIIVSLS